MVDEHELIYMYEKGILDPDELSGDISDLEVDEVFIDEIEQETYRWFLHPVYRDVFGKRLFEKCRWQEEFLVRCLSNKHFDYFDYIIHHCAFSWDSAGGLIVLQQAAKMDLEFVFQQFIADLTADRINWMLSESLRDAHNPSYRFDRVRWMLGMTLKDAFDHGHYELGLQIIDYALAHCINPRSKQTESSHRMEKCLILGYLHIFNHKDAIVRMIRERQYLDNILDWFKSRINSRPLEDIREMIFLYL